MATDGSHRVIMGKRRHHVFSTVFDPILFILAGNNDIHKSLDEFEIWPDSILDYGVNDIITFSPQFFIRSFSYLKVMKACIKAWMNLNFGQIPPLSTE